MLLRFPATLNVKDYFDHNITKADNLVCLRYDPIYADKIRSELRKINVKNEDNASKGKEPVSLDVVIDIHYVKRSLDQNAWIWAAHELEANIVNGRKSAWTDDQRIRWRQSDSVTPEMIHSDYMEQYAPRGYIDVQPGFVDAVRKMITETMGRVVSEKWDEAKKCMTFEIWKTSSYMNVAEFCQLAEKVEANLLAYGIDITNGQDFKVLSDSLKEIKSKAQEEGTKSRQVIESTDEVKQVDAKCIQLATSADTLTQSKEILTNPVDSANIVADVFKGKIEPELEIF